LRQFSYQFGSVARGAKQGESRACDITQFVCHVAHDLLMPWIVILRQGGAFGHSFHKAVYQGLPNIDFVNPELRSRLRIVGMNAAPPMEHERNSGAFRDLTQKFQIQACLLPMFGSDGDR
jgi:hypothetical protein